MSSVALVNKFFSEVHSWLGTSVTVSAVAILGDMMYTIFTRTLHRRAMLQHALRQTTRSRIMCPGKLGKPSNNMICRFKALEVIERAFGPTRTTVLCLLSPRGSGATSLIRQFVHEHAGTMHLPMGGCRTLDDVVKTLASELQLADSMKASVLRMALNKITGMVKESADVTWEVVQEAFESVATGLIEGHEAKLPFGSLALFFDELDNLDDEAIAALTQWTMSCQSRGIMHSVFIIQTPLRLMKNFWSHRLDTIRIPDASVSECVQFMTNRCPVNAMSRETALRIVTNYCGTNLGEVDRACRHFELSDSNTMETLHAMYLQVASISCRPYHLVAVQPCGDQELDEIRFYLFRLLMHLLDHEIGTVALDVQPESVTAIHAHLKPTTSSVISFEQLYEIVPLRIVETMIAKGIPSVLSFQFNAVGLSAPFYAVFLEFTLGAKGP
eukprot:PhF_6_TR4841/c0_g1_i2/m.6746